MYIDSYLNKEIVYNIQRENIMNNEIIDAIVGATKVLLTEQRDIAAQLKRIADAIETLTKISR